MLKIKEYVYESFTPAIYQQNIQPRVSLVTTKSYFEYLDYLKTMKNEGRIDYRAERRMNEVTIKIWV